MTPLRRLYFAFFRIGLFTFGGGYAMLPMLEREVVERNNWSTREQLLDYFAIGQCTPGIIAVNTATLVGYARRGFWGAAVATAGVVTPSFLVIVAIAAALRNFMHVDAVTHAFAGIRVAVSVLIFAAVVKLFKSNVLQKPTTAGPRRLIARTGVPPLFLCLGALASIALLHLSPVYVTVAAGIAGLWLYGKRGAQ